MKDTDKIGASYRAVVLLGDYEIAAMRVSDYDPQPIKGSYEDACERLLEAKHEALEYIATLENRLRAAEAIVRMVESLQCCDGEDARRTPEMRQAMIDFDAAYREHPLTRAPGR